uniref:RNA 3'-terminal phosphate cyclase n=1 Tax=Pseudonaja textilis TaxID=8673 RepID=A0A670Y6G4_PSETE
MGDEGRVEIDGSVMEGGGQILRVSTALSCLLNKSLQVKNIRAGRSQPGLRPQHLSGLEMVRHLCDGQMEGGDIGSTEITFTPGKIKGGTHTADTKTAGSVCLLMQVAMPCVLFAASPSELRLKGGTNAEMAPQIDYTLMVSRSSCAYGWPFDLENQVIFHLGLFHSGLVQLVLSVQILEI